MGLRKYLSAVAYFLRHPFISLSLCLDRTVFKQDTEEEKIAKKMRAAQLEADQALHVIRDHMFTEHMARSEIRALENWNNQTDLLCREPFPNAQWSDDNPP